VKKSSDIWRAATRSYLPGSKKRNLDQNSIGTLPKIAEAGSEIFSSPGCPDYFGG
jgi:hypothetical protein